jgi:hypothetical protein
VLAQLVDLSLGGLTLDLAFYRKIRLVGLLLNHLLLRLRGGAHLFFFAAASTALLNEGASIIEAAHGHLSAVFAVVASDEISAVQMGQTGIGLQRKILQLFGLRERTLVAKVVSIHLDGSTGGYPLWHLVDLLLEVLEGPLLTLLHLDQHLLHLVELLVVVSLQFLELRLLLCQHTHRLLPGSEISLARVTLSVKCQACLSLRLPALIELIVDDLRLHYLALDALRLRIVDYLCHKLRVQRSRGRLNVSTDLRHVLLEHRRAHHRPVRHHVRILHDLHWRLFLSHEVDLGRGDAHRHDWHVGAHHLVAWRWHDLVLLVHRLNLLL